jgi:hypothetical protein
MTDGQRMESKPVMVDPRQILVLLDNVLTLAQPLIRSLLENGALGLAPSNSHHPKPRAASEPQSNGLGALMRSPIDPDKDYNLHFVAKQLGKSTASVRKMVNKGTIVAEKIGNGKGQFFVNGKELIKHTSGMTTYS